jgi:hypothetical protein
LCEGRTEVESTNHLELTLAREMWRVMRLDLLMVVFAMVVTAHCSVVIGERQGGDERAAGARAGGESKMDEWGQAAAAACLGEWF